VPVSDLEGCTDALDADVVFRLSVRSESGAGIGVFIAIVCIFATTKITVPPIRQVAGLPVRIEGFSRIVDDGNVVIHERLLQAEDLTQ